MPLVRDGFGQLDPAVDTASTAIVPDSASIPSGSLLPFYLIATAAGLTVYFLTRYFDRSRKRR